jgi:predicted helicase
MRRSPNKKYGYIIIPILVAPGVAPEEALNDNSTFKVVWDVLNALKAHDDRFNSRINQMRFNEKMPDGGGCVLIGGPARNVKREGEEAALPRQNELLRSLPEFEE